MELVPVHLYRQFADMPTQGVAEDDDDNDDDGDEFSEHYWSTTTKSGSCQESQQPLTLEQFHPR